MVSNSSQVQWHTFKLMYFFRSLSLFDFVVLQIPRIGMCILKFWNRFGYAPFARIVHKCIHSMYMHDMLPPLDFIYLVDCCLDRCQIERTKKHNANSKAHSTPYTANLAANYNFNKIYDLILMNDRSLAFFSYARIGYPIKILLVQSHELCSVFALKCNRLIYWL